MPSPPTSPSRTRSGCARCPSRCCSNPPRVAPIEVDGVTYTIKSETKWITDDLGGEPGLRLQHATRSSTCRSARRSTSKIVGKQMKPVTVDSLVAPTTEWAENHGTLAVKVVDRTNTKGVAGIAVTATSPGFTPPTQPPPTPRLRRLQVGAGRQLHDHAQQPGLPEPRRRADVAGGPDGRRQDDHYRDDDVRPRDQRARRRQDARARLRTGRPADATAVEGAQRVADQRRQRRPAPRRSPRRARRSRPSPRPRCSRSPRTTTRSSPAPARTPAPTRTSRRTRTTTRRRTRSPR